MHTIKVMNLTSIILNEIGDTQKLLCGFVYKKSHNKQS
jgi:hypothetical protein